MVITNCIENIDSNCTHAYIINNIELDSLALSRSGFGGVDSNAEASNGASRKLLAELLLQLTECKQICTGNPNNSDICANNEECLSPQIASRSITSSSISTTTKRIKLQDIRENSLGTHTVSPTNIHKENNSSTSGMVVVIAATNRIQDIDEAILRRFESKIQIQLPNSNERVMLIQKYLGNIPHVLSSEDLDLVSDQTDGWTGSEIENLTREAAMRPVRRAFPLKQVIHNTELSTDGRDPSNKTARQMLQITLAVAKSKPIIIDPIALQDFSK